MKPYISLFILLAAALLSASVNAATFTVTKTADTADSKCDQDCSLREAIIAANTLGGADQIILPEGTYKITLIEGPDDDVGLKGDFDVKTDITITGTKNADVSKTAISGDKKSGVFDVFGSAVLTLENVAVYEGFSQAGAGIRVTQGAGILLKGTLVAVNISPTMPGGGIYISSTGKSIISDSMIAGNVTNKFGGGIYVDGTLRLERTIVGGNAAGDADFQGHGAGIYISKGSVEIVDSFVKGNIASWAGGGIYNFDASTSITILRSTFSSNKAKMGGGIYEDVGTITITDSTFESNEATTDNGGAISSGGTVTINNSTLYGNQAAGVGGAISITQSAALTLNNDTITYNVAAEGGGIFNSAQGTMHNSIITYNIGTGGQGGNNIFGPLTSGGYNLLSLESGNPQGNQLQATDIKADAAAAALGNFTDNEVAGRGHVVLLGISPALNNGDAECPVKDQLGNSRVGKCDIGAVEAVCGDGVSQSVNGEQCEDGNTIDTDACTNTCKIAKCGDGIVQAGFEVCDDGNNVDDDACPNSCKSPTCGDKIVQKGNGETCDDGNADNADACLNSCIAAKFGDGIVQIGVEACDDGNVKDGDGCSATGVVEKAKTPAANPFEPPKLDPAAPLSGAGEGVVLQGSDGSGEFPHAPASATSGGGGCSLIR